jgi:hypothetical protein
MFKIHYYESCRKTNLLWFFKLVFDLEEFNYKKIITFNKKRFKTIALNL